MLYLAGGMCRPDPACAIQPTPDAQPGGGWAATRFCFGAANAQAAAPK